VRRAAGREMERVREKRERESMVIRMVVATRESSSRRVVLVLWPIFL
jgi:hypothetical protein